MRGEAPEDVHEQRSERGCMSIDSIATTVAEMDVPAAAAASSLHEVSSSTDDLRAKINISLKKKTKTTSSASSLRQNATSNLLADEYTTIAEEAAIISQQRREEGSVLIIPCKQSKHEEEQKKPLLAGRLALLRRQQDEGGASDGGGVETITTRDEISATGINVDEINDDAVMRRLIIQSAELPQGGNGNESTTSRGQVVISAPSRNKLKFARGNHDNNLTAHKDTRLNGIDDENFKRELSHHAADVHPTSNTYANVAISDFGSALLRGMGWSASVNDGIKPNNSGGEEETIEPRPYRLGLGATPLMPLPSRGGVSNGNGSTIHRRARRPEDVKRDEERQRQQEEIEKAEEERKRLDVQFTLQKGSIVHVIDQDINKHGHDESMKRKRAVVIRTAGVPGLNRILIQIENAVIEASVAKHSVALCSWEELEAHPFQQRPLQQAVKGHQLPTVQGEQVEKEACDRKRNEICDPKLVRHDEHHNEMRNNGESERKNRRNSSEDNSVDDIHRRHSKDHKRMRESDRYHRRSRSRSGSRERSTKRSKECSDSHRDRRKERCRSLVGEQYHNSFDRKRTKMDHLDSQKAKQYLHWLIPSIRVRLISNKMPKYHLQKGVVQDVLRATDSKSSSGPKAILLMDDGQVLDKVPERYLETALPKTGGNVIILEGVDDVRWKKGRLLERSSTKCLIQLEEDLEVVNVSLDNVAEWCGDLNDHQY